MKRSTGIGTVTLLVLLGIIMLSHRAVAAEGEDTGWKNTAELGVVATGGNTESTTFGFKDTLTRDLGNASWTFKAAGLRVESATGVRWILDEPGEAPVVNDPEKETTAENYALSGRYARGITERMAWYAGLGWDRNRFTGINSRYIAEGGLSNIWEDGETVKFQTSYGITYTSQEDIVVAAGADRRDSFAGARGSWDYAHKFGANTEYGNTLVVDLNLDETDDLRADMVNSLSVKMSDRMAIKVSLQILYDNLPSMELVQVFTDPLDYPGGPFTTTLIELDDIDTIFTTALVIDF